jgi:hypothetical protein
MHHKLEMACELNHQVSFQFFFNSLSGSLSQQNGIIFPSEQNTGLSEDCGTYCVSWEGPLVDC